MAGNMKTTELTATNKVILQCGRNGVRVEAIEL
jgi:hypothetical protein